MKARADADRGQLQGGHWRRARVLAPPGEQGGQAKEAASRERRVGRAQEARGPARQAPVQVGGQLGGAVKVDDCLHPQDVQAAGSHVRGQQEGHLALQAQRSGSRGPG